MGTTMLGFSHSASMRVWVINMLGEWVMVRDMDILFGRRDSRRLLVSVSPLRGFALDPLCVVARDEATLGLALSFGYIRNHSVRA